MDHRRVRVLIADGHELTREGWHGMLEHDASFEVVAEAANGHDAVRLCACWRPDLALLDLHLPGLNGIEATRAIRTAQPETHVLIVATQADPDELREAASAGAAGYLLKDITRAALFCAIRHVLRADDLGRPADLEQHATPGRDTLPIAPLTRREHDVLHHLAQGRSNQEIADRLVIGRGTVKGYVENIIRKLGAADRTQAAVTATRLGLVGAAS
jgi:DNA-binding NarL/FixJ family response regulator